MNAFSRQHWLLAVTIAILIHIGGAFFVLYAHSDTGSVAAGAGGISVALGPAGRAPGSVEAVPPPTAPETAKTSEELEKVSPNEQLIDEPPVEDAVEVEAPDEKAEAAKDAKLAAADTIDEVMPKNLEKIEANESETTAPELEVRNEDLVAEVEDQPHPPSELVTPDQAVDDVTPDAVSDVEEVIANTLQSETTLIDREPNEAEISEPEDISTVALAEATNPKPSDAPLTPEKEAEEVASAPIETVNPSQEPVIETAPARDVVQTIEPGVSPDAVEAVEVDQANEVTLADPLVKSSVAETHPFDVPVDNAPPAAVVAADRANETRPTTTQIALAEAREIVPEKASESIVEPTTRPSDTPVDDAQVSELPLQAEVAPDSASESLPETTQAAVAEITDIRPSPRKPPLPQEESSEPPTEEPAIDPPQLAGAGGEAGDQADADLGTGQSSSGGGATGAQADYFALLQAWLEQHKVYPRRALSRRLEGVVSLRFVMDRNGQILDYNIEKSSGHRLLDRAVETLIKRAQPLPTMPDDLRDQSLTLVVPISFVLD